MFALRRGEEGTGRGGDGAAGSVEGLAGFGHNRLTSSGLTSVESLSYRKTVAYSSCISQPFRLNYL